MKKSLKKEYEFLTSTHQKLFRSEVMSNYKWTTVQAFYKLIRGERKISEAEYIYLREKMQFYFEIQRQTGKMFLEL